MAGCEGFQTMLILCFFFLPRLTKMADDIDIEAMLEAPYRKVRKICHMFLFLKLS